LTTANCPRVMRTSRSSSLRLCTFGALLSAFVGCGGAAKPQIASMTFTTDSFGTKIVCTTAITADLPSNTPLCTSSLIPKLVVGGPAAYMYANVTKDNELLGVSWTVTCGSASSVGTGTIDTSCGSFSPAQTASGPVPLYPSSGIVTTYHAPSAVPKGGTVTITAHATSLPSIASSITLTVVAAQGETASPGRQGHASQVAANPVQASPLGEVTGTQHGLGL